MIGNPLAETHRGNSTFYSSILDHLRGFEIRCLFIVELWKQNLLLIAESPLYQERQNHVRAHRIGEIQRERRKGNHQEMEEKKSKRDELVKKLKTSSKVHHPHRYDHHHFPPPPPGTGPSALTSAASPDGMDVA